MSETTRAATSRVVRGIVRPREIDLAALSEFSVSRISDAQEGQGLLDPSLRPVADGLRAWGPAVTVECEPGDSLMVHAAIEVARPGDMLVIASGGAATHALVTDLIATECRARGIVGVVVEGGARDVLRLRDIGFPVWSRAIHALGTTMERGGSVNVPVTCAGVFINPGDAVVADDDGVVVVPRDRVVEVLEAARLREERDQDLRERFARGELSLDALDLRPRLESHGVRYEDGEPEPEKGEAAP